MPEPVVAATAEDEDEEEADELASEAEDEDMEEIKVTSFDFEGKKYARSPDNTVFDIETSDEIGTWNEETKKIEFS